MDIEREPGFKVCSCASSHGERCIVGWLAPQQNSSDTRLETSTIDVPCSKALRISIRERRLNSGRKRCWHESPCQKKSTNDYIIKSFARCVVQAAAHPRERGDDSRVCSSMRSAGSPSLRREWGPLYHGIQTTVCEIE